MGALDAAPFRLDFVLLWAPTASWRGVGGGRLTSRGNLTGSSRIETALAQSVQAQFDNEQRVEIDRGRAGIGLLYLSSPRASCIVFVFKTGTGEGGGFDGDRLSFLRGNCHTWYRYVFRLKSHFTHRRMRNNIEKRSKACAVYAAR